MGAAQKKDPPETFTRADVEKMLKEKDMPEDEKRVRAIVREESRATFLETLKEFFGEGGAGDDDDDGEERAPKNNEPPGKKKGRGLLEIFSGEKD